MIFQKFTNSRNPSTKLTLITLPNVEVKYCLLKCINPCFSFILHFNCILSSNTTKNFVQNVRILYFPCLYPWNTIRLTIRNLIACYCKLVPSLESILLTKIASGNWLGEALCSYGQDKWPWRFRAIETILLNLASTDI